jgi:hypothetical protein
MKGKCEADLLGENGLCMQNGEYCNEESCNFDYYQPMERNCSTCKHSWYHEQSYGEVIYDGPSGWVCDGHENPGIANLKSFPFKKEMDCFEF